MRVWKQREKSNAQHAKSLRQTLLVSTMCNCMVKMSCAKFRYTHWSLHGISHREATFHVHTTYLCQIWNYERCRNKHDDNDKFLSSNEVFFSSFKKNALIANMTRAGYWVCLHDACACETHNGTYHFVVNIFNGISLCDIRIFPPKNR